MNPTDKGRRLADEILVFFKNGISIDDSIQHYIDICLPGVSMEEVAHQIDEPPDLDTAPLMELIFFPDEALQVRLEPLLEAEIYDDNDETFVAELLKAEPVHTTWQVHRLRKAIPVRVPPSVLAPFVRRLGISRRIPPRLAAAIADVHPAETAIRLKVRLRNAQFPIDAPAADFLEAFVLGMDPGSKDYDTCFKLALELLGERRDESDPFRGLRLKTDALYRAKNAALQFEKQLQRSNMETLMHQGVRAPVIGVGEAEKKIALLDQIGRAVAIGSYKAKH